MRENILDIFWAPVTRFLGCCRLSCLGCCRRRAHAARTKSHVGSVAVSSAAVKLRAASRQKWLHPQQGENGSKSMQQRAVPTKPGVIGGAGGGWGGRGEKGGHGGVCGGNGARGGPLAPWQMKSRRFSQVSAHQLPAKHCGCAPSRPRLLYNKLYTPCAWVAQVGGKRARRHRSSSAGGGLYRCTRSCTCTCSVRLSSCCTGSTENQQSNLPMLPLCQKASPSEVHRHNDFVPRWE